MTTEKQKNGSHLLLEHAFRQYHASLFFYALKFIDNKELAKDMVQDAFLSLLNFKQQSEVNNLKAYLFRAVRNNCLNHIKHTIVTSEFAKNEQERISREIKFYDTHQTLVEKELQEKVNEAVSALPDKYRIPFELSRFNELSNKEIAEQLNLPIRTVETQLYRALKLLRESLINKGILLFTFLFFK
ncbi:RNA polymerase sigma-70 factor [Draconibacterium sp.]|uniref:RNA polymerase sigma-70 factor n=1 Tax=Draconibacterium sp. TaxID=1965318 RepID=UPI003562764A